MLDDARALRYGASVSKRRGGQHLLGTGSTTSSMVRPGGMEAMRAAAMADGGFGARGERCYGMGASILS